MGEPISAVISAAISPVRPAKISARRPTAAARSAGSVRGQGPVSKATRAAATARSMSAVVPAGTRPMTCSVCGETTSMTSVPAGATQSPPMNRRSRVIMMCLRSARRRRAVVVGSCRYPDAKASDRRHMRRTTDPGDQHLRRAVYRQLVADATARQEDEVAAGRVGHPGASLASSAADLPPDIGTSDQPQPEPADPTVDPNEAGDQTLSGGSTAAVPTHTHGSSTPGLDIQLPRGEPCWGVARATRATASPARYPGSSVDQSKADHPRVPVTDSSRE